MDPENQPNKNRSLGNLGPAKKTKPRSPDCTGKVRLKRGLVLIFLKQLERSQGDEVICNIAGWKKSGVYGPFLTVEISPRYERRVEPIESDPFADLVWN